MKIRVLLAEDHQIVREGLRLVLDSAPDLEVVAAVCNGAEAIKSAAKLRPHVILLDVMMPQINGIQAVSELVKVAPESKILMLSSFSDEDRVRELVSMGVAGYVMKESAANELLDAVRLVHRGNLYFSGEISQKLVEQGAKCVSTQSFKPKTKQNLTPRESQVLLLIAQGLPNKAIAADLAISIKTVEKHRQQVMTKLNIHHAAGLTRYAHSTCLIDASGAACARN